MLLRLKVKFHKPLIIIWVYLSFLLYVNSLGTLTEKSQETNLWPLLKEEISTIQTKKKTLQGLIKTVTWVDQRKQKGGEKAEIGIK